MTKLLIIPITILSLSSCIKSRQCICRNSNGEEYGTVTVTAVSGKRANERCYMVLNDTDRDAAKKAVAEGKADCLVE